MALSKEEIKNDYPIPQYNYRVEVGDQTIACSKVSGLSMSFENKTYKESPTESGTPGPRVMHMPGQPAAVTVTLTKGVVKAASVNAFYKWISSTQVNQIDKKDIYVRLCDETGAPVISWKVINAFPTKLDAPSFDAAGDEVAIEEMTLTGDKVLVEEA